MGRCVEQWTEVPDNWEWFGTSPLCYCRIIKNWENIWKRSPVALAILRKHKSWQHVGAWPIPTELCPTLFSIPKGKRIPMGLNWTEIPIGLIIKQKTHPSWRALQLLLLQAVASIAMRKKKSSQSRCSVLRPTCGSSNPCNGSCNWSDLFDRPHNYSKPSDATTLMTSPVPPAGSNCKYPVNTFLYMRLSFQSLFLLWMEKKSSSAASTRPYQALVYEDCI